jgi:hypothetical protein
MVCRNVDLFDFVVDDHHESSDLALDYGDRGVIVWCHPGWHQRWHQDQV